EHAPAEAAKLLARAVQRGKLSGTDLLRAQVALARVARAAGELPQAAQAVTAALSLSPEDVQAHVQAILIELDRGSAEQAASPPPAVGDGRGAPGLGALLGGRVQAAQQHWRAAAGAFDRGAAADSRRTDAALWGGAAWAMTGSRERALQSAAPA